jgi:hypothetical protein
MRPWPRRRRQRRSRPRTPHMPALTAALAEDVTVVAGVSYAPAHLAVADALAVVVDVVRVAPEVLRGEREGLCRRARRYDFPTRLTASSE